MTKKGPGRQQKRRQRASPHGGGDVLDATRRRNLRLETIGDIAAVLRHESRNLLGALQTCLQILRRNPQLTPADRELLDIIEDGSKRLGDVMSDFSFFRRNAKPQRDEFNIHELLEEILTRLQQDGRFAPTLRIHKSLDARVVSIRADRDHLRHALRHLFLNGAQAAGEQGTLSIKTGSVAGEIRIVIGDNGPGIRASEMLNIFEPLYTTKTRGAGLGLAIVKRVIDQHGGHVIVKTRRSVGTSFTVRLPARRKANNTRRSPSGGSQEVERWRRKY